MNTASPPRPMCPICTRPRDATPDNMFTAGVLVGIVARGNVQVILASFCAVHRQEFVTKVKATNVLLASLLGVK